MDVQGKLLEAFDEILDKMAFLFFEEPEEDQTPPDSYDFLTHIGFKGVISGSLNIFLTRAVAENLARNLVGIRDEDELFDSTVQDAVCEFTNMVMGRTLTVLDPNHGFEMEVPSSVTEATPPGDNDQEVDVEGVLDGDFGRILLRYKTP